MNEVELKALDAQYCEGKTPQEAADILNGMTKIVPVTDPIDYGTIAANSAISSAEYNVLRAVIAGACAAETAAGGYLINDMHKRMESGLGIDPSCQKTIDTMEACRPQFRTALGGDAAGDALVTKLLAMGQSAVPLLTYFVWHDNISYVRTL